MIGARVKVYLVDVGVRVVLVGVGVGDVNHNNLPVGLA